MKTLGATRILFFFCLFWFLTSLSTVAQGQNLLSNPSFEKPFATLGGSPPRQVAQGWSPWHVGGGGSSSENVQPEYYPASDVSNGLGVPRIRTGSDAQQYHSLFASHDGGLFQRVTGVTKGTQLRFSAYVYVWSSTFDDPNKSEGDGGVVVMVGIDPTGGTDAESANIIWSAASVQYDAYNEYSVTGSASETAVTVYVRTTVSVPVKSSNIYVDDASLVSTGSSAPTATLAATKTPIPPSPTNTLPPTATQVRPTATSVPTDLGIVATPTPPPTSTPLPTATLVPPTATLVPSATSTLIPSFTPTNILPTAPPSNTPLPAPTQELPSATPVATATLTLTPSATPVGGVYFGKVIHIVRTGDTVGQLAALYGSTVEVISEANGIGDSALIRVGQTLVIPVRLSSPATSTPTATPLVPPTAPPPVTTSYVVRPGDTLFRIALRFNTTTATLAQLNGITNANVIRVGQTLVIPVGGGTGAPPPPTVAPAATQAGGVVATSAPPPASNTYVVRPGDTLFRIALRFGVPLRSLIQANGIRDANRVFVGQVLVIP